MIMRTLSPASAENDFGDIPMENISGMANKKIEETYFIVALSLREANLSDATPQIK